jgi:hypothetical protein
MKTVYAFSLFSLSLGALLAADPAAAETASESYRRRHPERWAERDRYHQQIQGRITALRGDVVYRKSDWDCDDTPLLLGGWSCRTRAKVGTEIRPGDKIDRRPTDRRLAEAADEMAFLAELLDLAGPRAQARRWR